MNAEKDEINRLEIEKLSLEIKHLQRSRGGFYSKYGDLIRLVIGFVLTGVIGTVVAALVQHGLETSKSQEVKSQRLIEKCEATLEEAEMVLAKRQYYQLKIIQILKARASGDWVTDAEIEDELMGEYLDSVEEWNLSLNMNRIIIARVFGEDVGGVFYGGGEGVAWEDMSITLKFVTIHKSVMIRWRKYKLNQDFQIDNLMKNHWDLSDQIAGFYDSCLKRILDIESAR